MTIQPLLDAPLLVQCHVITAFAALLLTPAILLRRKGDRRHRILGRFWVLAMGATALSSFAITDIRVIGPFSPIHGLSLLTLFSLGAAIVHARQGRIEAHKGSMFGVMFGLVGAGVFTVIPGRLMSDILFPNAQLPGFAFVLGLGVCALVLLRKTLGRSPRSKSA